MGCQEKKLAETTQVSQIRCQARRLHTETNPVSKNMFPGKETTLTTQVAGNFWKSVPRQGDGTTNNTQTLAAEFKNKQVNIRHKHVLNEYKADQKTYGPFNFAISSRSLGAFVGLEAAAAWFWQSKSISSSTALSSSKCLSTTFDHTSWPRLPL